MKKALFISFIVCALAGSETALGAAAKPIVFRGDTLELNTEFKRTQCGMSPSSMVEISGLACSRVTPGYLWAQSDDNYRVIAMNEKGNIFFNLTLTNKPSRSDWEDMCIGQYKGKSTIFVGGFGDNNLKYNNKYYVFYFDEPAIPDVKKDSTIQIGTRYILYGYPDNVAHDAEAMMYDNIDSVLYIVDKSDRGICKVYSLPMDTVYGNELQRLTYVCDLGTGDETQFCRVTAADISPDGHWIIIKNYDVYREKQYALIWERKDGESVAEALLRQPQQIAAYLAEWQGEAVAWLDSDIFYTTSDEDGSAPIYKYDRSIRAALQETTDRPLASKVIQNGHLYIIADGTKWTIDGQKYTMHNNKNI